MPRYRYTRATVYCIEQRVFKPSQIREAVEHLKTVPGADNPKEWIGLMAETLVKAGNMKLKAQPFLRLHDILGHTPTKVWEKFDSIVDDQRNGLIRRWLGHEPTSYNEYLK